LAIAKAPLPQGAFYEDLCFHAQQAAEKALKAVYVNNGWVFGYTHDLEALLSGLMQQGLDVPPEIVETDALSRYAWEARYPGPDEPVTGEEYQEAVQITGVVLNWASTQSA
jgi:HEPN domain-containing protein